MSMRRIRLPYPEEPEPRRRLVDRARGLVKPFGVLDGTTEAGTFRASTPIGRFAGTYHSPPGCGEVEIELAEKPWLVSLHRFESEVRKFLAAS
jgi:hypothetical protein